MEKLKNYKINQYIQKLKNILQREHLMNQVIMLLNHSVSILQNSLNDEVGSRGLYTSNQLTDQGNTPS